MTPREFSEMVDAVIQEEKRRVSIQSFFAAHQISYTGRLKEPIQPKELYECIFPEPKRKPSPEEIQKRLKEAREKGVIPDAAINQ